MFKRFVSFALSVCLILGCNTFSDGTAYAEDIPGELPGIEQAFSPGNDSLLDTNESSELYLPSNPPQVNMGSVQQQSTLRLQNATNKTTENVKRYTVLVLDTSSSSYFADAYGNIFYIADTAIKNVKESSKKFIEDVQSADGTNYIAIVSYSGGTSIVVSPFSSDLKVLTADIDKLYASGYTRSVEAGLQAVDNLFSGISDPDALKNAVLFTTGMTNDGKYSYGGHYSEATVGSNWRRSDNQVRLYAYANAAYSAAEKLKTKCTLYTIGLFNTMDDMPEQGRDVVQFFKLCALEWATSSKHFYDVKDTNDLDFVFGEVADIILKKTGIFKYPGEGRDYSATYYYDDSYFYSSSYIHNQHLATMSLCLELSAWGSEEVGNDYTRKMKNAEKLFYDIGFVGFDHNYTDYENNGVIGKPNMDSIGAVAAHKQITVNSKDYTLIALVVRGGGYESEWASNFKIGESGQHQGFSEARDKVLSFLQTYIKRQGINGNIKLWITGYSRAAATANMVAGAIDAGSVSFTDCNLALSDLYAYTFETPAGALKSDTNSTVFNNIFNVINPNDPVPKVAPGDWQFRRYGIDKDLPSETADGKTVYEIKYVKMLMRYSLLEGYSSYENEKFAMKKLIDGWSFLNGEKLLFVNDTKNQVPQEIFLDGYITMLAKEFLKNRENYVEHYQEGIREICGMFFGASKSQTEILKASLVDKFTNNWGAIVWDLLRPFGGEDDAYDRVAKYLRESLKEANISYTETELDNAVTSLMDLVVVVALNHPNLATTLVMNIELIGQTHYPELCLAWMQSMDSHYTPGGAVGYTSGKYRIVRINCPVDVKVYNKEGTLVAAIIEDVPQVESSIISAINEDGEKLVYLPASNDYTIKLTATGNGLVTYSLNEYDPQAGEINKLVNYYDVPIVIGQELVGIIPSYSTFDLENTIEAASSTRYTLSTNGNEIIPSDELFGEAATSAYFDINATIEDSSKGVVFGSGIRRLGTFAKVTAQPYEGSSFIGWFENGTKLVSSDLEYRFRVARDINLIAKFESAPNQLKINAGVGGTIIAGTNGNYEYGDTINLSAKADQGYVFKNWVTSNGGTFDNKDSATTKFTMPANSTTVSAIFEYVGAESNIKVTFNVTSKWGSAFNADVTITNISDKVIDNWVLKFDLPYEITNIWNGVIVTNEDGTYVIKNAGHNQDINPGSSVSFGISANTTDEIIIQPDCYAIIGKETQAVSDKYLIDFEVISDWKSAYNGQIVIKNISDEIIEDWILEFDFDHEITAFWTADIISHEGNHYIVKNKGYNSNINPGQSVTLGFTGNPGNVVTKPESYALTYVGVE